MKPTRKMQRLLEQMTKIERMERGKLCRMSGRPHYNHQTWENKRNVVRYVPADEAAFVQEAIDGYARFKQLAEAYAEEVIAKTRSARAQTFANRTGNTAKRIQKPKEKKNQK